MTIRRDRVGLWTIACDRCANAAQYALAADYFETYKEAKLDGWLARRVDDDWIHVCPTCLPAFYPDKPVPVPVPRDLFPVRVVETRTCMTCGVVGECQLGRMEYFCDGIPEPRYHVRWWCLSCHGYAAPEFINREKVAEYRIVREQLPILPRPTTFRRAWA